MKLNKKQLVKAFEQALAKQDNHTQWVLNQIKTDKYGISDEQYYRFKHKNIAFDIYFNDYDDQGWRARTPRIRLCYGICVDNEVVCFTTHTWHKQSWLNKQPQKRLLTYFKKEKLHKAEPNNHFCHPEYAELKPNN